MGIDILIFNDKFYSGREKMNKTIKGWLAVFLVLGSLGLLLVYSQSDPGPGVAPMNPAFLERIEKIRNGTYISEPG